MWNANKLTYCLIVFIYLSGCSASPTKRAEELAANGDWLKAVMAYRAELQKDPDSIELKTSLRQAELRAADYYFQLGVNEMDKGNYDDAIAQLEQGLASMPGNEKLQNTLRVAAARREASSMLKDARRYREIGVLEQEKRAIEKALQLAPRDEQVLKYWNELQARISANKKSEFELKTKEKITLNFKDAKIKDAFNFISDTFGINVIFDEGVNDKTITLYAKRITFRQALDLLMGATNTFYKKVSSNTILIAPDTKDKRGQYEDYIIRTFHLTNASAKQMSDILKGILSPQKIVVNEELNTLTVRDTKEMLELAAKIVEANDIKPAELLLEVDILEVNRQKAKQLGFDYGSTLTLTYPDYNVGGAFSDTLANGVLTLPSPAFHYFKQNVDAKTLANPKIRVLDGKEAKIHIGDRVPLRSSTIQEATGQTRTTYQYTDIGIRLTVQPEIELDNSTLVKLGLEVSSLGQNLGTAAEPAYSIGTRNADTYMVLRDGETALLGGLIRDEDRKATVKIPGLGDIPILGALFSSVDNSTLQTDVLLTITPRILRPWQLPPRDTWSIYSGKANRYFTHPLLSSEDAKSLIAMASNDGSSLRSSNGTSVASLLSLDKHSYRTVKGDEVVVKFIKSGKSKSSKLPLHIRFDDGLLQLKSIEPSAHSKIELPDNIKDGDVDAVVSLDGAAAEEAGNVVATAHFEAKSDGVSYLIVDGNLGADNQISSMPVSLDSAYVVIE